MLLMLLLLIIPFVDRDQKELIDSKAAFNWRVRGWAFAAMIFFWVIFIVGVVQNALAGPS